MKDIFDVVDLDEHKTNMTQVVYFWIEFKTAIELAIVSTGEIFSVVELQSVYSSYIMKFLCCISFG